MKKIILITLSLLINFLCDAQVLKEFSLIKYDDWNEASMYSPDVLTVPKSQYETKISIYDFEMIHNKIKDSIRSREFYPILQNITDKDVKEWFGSYQYMRIFFYINLNGEIRDISFKLMIYRDKFQLSDKIFFVLSDAIKSKRFNFTKSGNQTIDNYFVKVKAIYIDFDELNK